MPRAQWSVQDEKVAEFVSRRHWIGRKGVRALGVSASHDSRRFGTVACLSALDG